MFNAHAVPNRFTSAEDFVSGAIILIDKPLGWTSFDAVNKIKFTLKNKLKTGKLKVGHAGTLDPLATGLLVICTGKMTKAITQLTMDDKVYTGIIRLGSTTASYDLETPPEQHKSFDHITRAEILMAMQATTGPIEQMPPLFSAKKVDGKRAYDLARAGNEVALRTARVIIHSFELTHFDGSDIHFLVKCSKGTYIRSLAHDLGQTLGCGAHLASLCRTMSGEFKLSEAINPTTFEEQIGVFAPLRPSLVK